MNKNHIRLLFSLKKSKYLSILISLFNILIESDVDDYYFVV